MALWQVKASRNWFCSSNHREGERMPKPTPTPPINRRHTATQPLKQGAQCSVTRRKASTTYRWYHLASDKVIFERDSLSWPRELHQVRKISSLLYFDQNPPKLGIAIAIVSRQSSSLRKAFVAVSGFA